ncbi:MAG TPA: LysM peptidoglycan-binding domain-containing protein [Bacteroidia bacterium]|nr:LysM peptidoglycan-binding domain-containing protein [Bacteroidia bacterium]
MQKVKLTVLTLFVFLNFHNSSVGQLEGSCLDNNQATVCNDPIVEMLDSLVMLNNVIRFNNLMGASGSNSSNDIINGSPVFTDEVYNERISKIVTPIPLAYNEQVKNYINLYAVKRRELTSRVLGLSQLYFPLFEEILDKEDLPIEFKYLSVVESALNPIAKSRVGATGIWQFMLNTGKLYDLKVNSYTDDRRDPVKSTYAACKYFKDMYDIYRDWLLVIAAYNCGPGNVNRAIVRSGGKTNFWEISRFLPKETRGYVPAFIAVCYVMNHSSEHNIFPVAPAFSYFEVDTIMIHQRTTLSKIAKNVDLPLDVVAFLNPVYKKGVIPETEQAQIVRLPANKVSAFLLNGKDIYTSDPPEQAPILATLPVNPKNNNDERDFEYTYKQVKKTHTVRRGETLSGLAADYNCSSQDIKKLNRLKSTRLNKGQKLKILAWVKIKNPVSKMQNTETAKNTVEENNAAAGNTGDSSIAMASEQIKSEDSTVTSENISNNPEQENQTNGPKYIFHLVQRGDTLWNIARRYEGATVDQIMELNKISNNKSLKAGTKLKVMISG